MRTPRLALSASMVVGLGSLVFLTNLAACTGDDDDDTYGLDSGLDATTSDGGAGDAATDAALDAGFDANSLTCLGSGGMCAASGQACIASGGSSVGTPLADSYCSSTAFPSAICCTMTCGPSPGNVCAYGLGVGPAYCQQGHFVCPDGTIPDAGAHDSGIADASDDGG